MSVESVIFNVEENFENKMLCGFRVEVLEIVGSVAINAEVRLLTIHSDTILYLTIS